MSMVMYILPATPSAGYRNSPDPLFGGWQECINPLPQFAMSQVKQLRMDGGDDQGLHILSLLPAYQSLLLLSVVYW